MPYKDPAKRKEYDRRRDEAVQNHAHESILSGEITDHIKWNRWCGKIKDHARSKQKSYSDDFTNDDMFNMMVKGCFFCGDIATTIDRLDSKLGHTLQNCVGSCKGCNNSKGVSDPGTFIRKAYFRVHGKYYDTDDNIWFVNKTKPEMSQYRKKIKNDVPFEMTKEVFNILIRGDCTYCRRKPFSWFGIDREVPPVGYVPGNIVTCCWDCNRDKHEDDNDTMYARNKRIADRLVSNELVIGDCEKTILHNGVSKTSKKVCVHGNVYPSMTDASNAIDKNWWYVSNIIKSSEHVNNIFEITDEFYEEYKDSDLYITKDMFTSFEHFYVNE